MPRKCWQPRFSFLPLENTQTFKIQVGIESLSGTVTLLVCLLLTLCIITAAAPFAISLVICNWYNFLSKAVLSGCQVSQHTMSVYACVCLCVSLYNVVLHGLACSISLAVSLVLSPSALQSSWNLPSSQLKPFSCLALCAVASNVQVNLFLCLCVWKSWLVFVCGFMCLCVATGKPGLYDACRAQRRGNTTLLSVCDAATGYKLYVWWTA